MSIFYINPISNHYMLKYAVNTVPVFLIGLLFLFFTADIFGQNAQNQWAYGSKAGLDFTTGTAVPITTEIVSIESAASVCGSNGLLLFYTDGSRIWDRNGNVMPGAQDLTGLPAPPGSNPTWSTSQGALIVPWPGDTTKYFVFSVSCLEMWPLSGRLYCNVVDMTLNGGMGDVSSTQSQMLVDTNLSERINAVAGDHCDIWVLTTATGGTPGLPTNMFKAFNITETGLNTTPVISMVTNAASNYGGRFHLRFSPNRKHVALTNQVAFSGNVIELHDFDPSTGIVSNQRVLETSSKNYRAICFSPDNSKLYVSETIAQLYQFNLTNPNLANIIASKTAIIGTTGADLKIGPDNKLYFPSLDYPGTLGIITNPNLSGTACNATDNVIQHLPNTAFMIAFPNDLAFTIPMDTTVIRKDTIFCSNREEMVLTAPPGQFNYRWDNGTTLANRTISQSGTYWVEYSDRCHFKIDSFIVKLIVVDDSFSLGADTVVCSSAIKLEAPITGEAYFWSDGTTGTSYQAGNSGAHWLRIAIDGCFISDTIQIDIKNIEQALGPDTSFCMGDKISLTLNANVQNVNAAILWSDGSVLPYLSVTDTGKFWITATDFPCLGTDTINIQSEYCDCRVMLPNAFSPNGDGVNDFFKPEFESPECLNPGTYSLFIYNRYGQRVYKGNETDKGWDGYFKGLPSDLGTYMFYFDYKLGTRQIKKSMKGDLTLIR